MAQTVRGFGITIVVILVILITMGACLGLNLGSTEWTNSSESKAEAETINVENDYQRAINEIELEHIEEKIVAQIEAETSAIKNEEMLANVDAEIEAQKRKDQLRHENERLEQKQQREHMLLMILIAAMGAGTLCAVLCMGYYTIRRINQNMAFEKNGMEYERSEAERWKDPAYRRKMIMEAKQREEQIRSIQLH